MIGVITGDIVNSRNVRNQRIWLTPLKKVLASYGESPKIWEIFRGDSFQLEIKKPEESLFAALRIKACIKSLSGQDVRMAIGIGDKTYNAKKITEANGSAFIHSGEMYEKLKATKRNIAIKTPWGEVDEEFNLMLNIASIIIDKWSTPSAELAYLSLQKQQLSQVSLGKKLKITQSSVSERQKRAYLNEVLALEAYFHKKIKTWIK